MGKRKFVHGWKDLKIANLPVEYGEKLYLRVLAIGDIHGQFTRFISMYRKLHVTACDLVIFLGDYVNGYNAGENIKTLKWLMKQNKKDNVIILSGNKERELRKEFFKKHGVLKRHVKNECDVWQELKDANNPKLNKKIYKFISNLKFYQQLTISGREFIFCHAGIKKGVELSEQKNKHFIYSKNFYKKYDGEEFFVVGHKPVQKAFGKKCTVPVKVADKNILMVDTFCKDKHGYSSCVNILTGEFWQSKKDW